LIHQIFFPGGEVDAEADVGDISGMTFTVNPVINAEHLGRIEGALRLTGVPGKVEIFDSFLEITPPIWGDPVALEILRPVVENILHDITKEILEKDRRKPSRLSLRSRS